MGGLSDLEEFSSQLEEKVMQPRITQFLVSNDVKKYNEGFRFLPSLD